jgi:glutamyl-tRNA synthetase
LLNYLALLGWSMGDDQEFFSLEQMAQAFSLERVSANPARFDLKKCTAINGDWIRALPAAELTERLLPMLLADGLVAEPPSEQHLAVLAEAVPLIQERMDTLNQAPAMLGFLLVDQVNFLVDDAEATAVLGVQAAPTIQAALDALSVIPEWTTEAIQAALRQSLVEGLGLKPKLAFGPIRVAITGRRISPPLFESMEILGREVSLVRLRNALDIE